MKITLLTFLFTLVFVGCGKNPSKALENEIKKRGYILYQNPLAHSGTGTMVGGRPSMMQLVTGPQTCFPDEIDGEPTNLRFIDQADLPNSYRRTTFTFGVDVGMLEIIANANGLVNFGAGMSSDIQITVEYEGATVEYIDAVKLKELYDFHMSETCKDFLDITGYITQALKVEKMRFSFKSTKTGQVNLSLGSFLGGAVIPSANANWYLEDNYTLTIDTPKYIGYQLGSLRRESEGYSMARATRIKKDAYVWESIRVFPEVYRRGEMRILGDERDFIPYQDVEVIE